MINNNIAVGKSAEKGISHCLHSIMLLKVTKLGILSLFGFVLLSSLFVAHPMHASTEQAQLQQQLPVLFVAGSSQSPTTTSNIVTQPTTSVGLAQHQLPLKGMKEVGDDIMVNENFKVDKSNILSIPLGQNINIFSSSQAPQFTITGAKLSTNVPDQGQLQQQKGNIIDLKPAPTMTNTFSLAVHPPGAYVLDVIINSGDIQGVYETLLQIVSQDPQAQKAIEKRTSELTTKVNTKNKVGSGGNELPLCDGSSQDCITERGDVCEVGTTAHECEIEVDENEIDLEEPADQTLVDDLEGGESTDTDDNGASGGEERGTEETGGGGDEPDSGSSNDESDTEGGDEEETQ